MSDILDDIKSGVDKIGDFLGGSGLTETLTGALLNDEFLKQLVKTLVELCEKLVEAANASLEANSEISKSVSKALEKLVDTVLNQLTEAAKTTAPGAFTKGPLAAIGAARELAALLKALNRLDRILDRLDCVTHSLEEMLNRVGKGGNLVVLKALINDLGSLLKKILEGNDSADELIVKFLIQAVFPIDAVTGVLSAAGAGKLWQWADVAAGFGPGDLNAWLNDPATYRNPADPSVVEREYRARLVAAMDAYIGGESGAPGARAPLAHSDTKLSAGLVSEVVAVFLDTTIQFVLEPECFPLQRFDVDWPEDVGLQFATGFARQIRIAIRGAIGLVLRGIWVWSVQNDVLIELIGSAISTAFSSLLDAVLRNLTWSLRIVSRYQGDPFGGPTGDVFSWQSLDKAVWQENGQNKIQFLEYVVLDRVSDMALAPALLNDNPTLAGLVKDFGAYIDVCYHQFQVGSRFPEVSADDVTITRAELDGDRLIVWATTSARFEKPRPVLRAYFCCHQAVMKPGAKQDDSYELTMPLPNLPRRCFELTVLSNRGGKSSRRVHRQGF